MKILIKILFIIFCIYSKSTAMAQVNLKTADCTYNGKDILLEVVIENLGDREVILKIDAAKQIVQMPFNPKGDELALRLRSNIPDAFIISCINDTLIKDFKFYTLDLKTFIDIKIPPKSSLNRQYKVTIIGDTTRKLLEAKSEELMIKFYLVYKLDSINMYGIAKAIKVRYLSE
jgi:hypothetical protein